MVKIKLEIRLTGENIDEVYTNYPNYNFLLKLKCLNCGELSNKWHDVMESQKFSTRMGKSDTNYLAKCKLCSRENSLEIIEGTNCKYTSNDQGKYKSLVTFDCRGIEPVDFAPSEGWIVTVEDSSKIFREVDLSEKEWVEYDDTTNKSVGIYEFVSQFVKIK